MSARKVTARKQPAANLPPHRSCGLLARSMALTARSLCERLVMKLAGGRDKGLFEARSSLAAALGHDVAADEAADILAQAAVCAAPIIAAASDDAKHALAWLLDQCGEWERWALKRAQELSTRHLPLSSSPAHLYELFLHRYGRQERKRRGVFFTPRPIARYIVAQVDSLLGNDFGLVAGLATQSAIGPGAPGHCAIPFLLDPAVGTGVFLLAAIEHIHFMLADKWKRECAQPAEINRRWNDYVPRLLSRLWGIEILPAAAMLAKLNIALQLAATGYRFDHRARINIVLGDALSPHLQTSIRNLQFEIPILLGNPPFSSLSTNTNDWIARLVRGDDQTRGYVQANGQRLGERKTWLHDDYVKFIRLAQWHVEQAGCGIVGFVTNHGYLDNATFWLMRQELLRVFSRVQIIDLHGSRKKHEAAPDGSRDENIFGLDQGVAISLFCRPPILARGVSEGISAPTGSRVEYAELWGSRDSKLQAFHKCQAAQPSLALRASVFTPHSRQWRLIPSSPAVSFRGYDSAWSLADAMPVNATAPVTARDHFVVAFTEEELQERVAEFRDLSIPDDEIRRRYFNRTRSARYVPGDTRGWKLAAARQVVAADNDWQRHIRRCLYRPFDWRFIFWHPAMIDWPRTEVTRHLIEKGQRDGGTEGRRDQQRKPVRGNQRFLRHSVTPSLRLALIARRQQLPSQPCTFFWIADCLPLDGVIRSDNRGSESLFPLYLREHDANGRATWRANFAADFVEEVCRRLRLAWLHLGRGDLERTLGPHDLLDFIYALFHASTYRERYAVALRLDFPRVLVPKDATLFQQMCKFGSELAALHLLQPPLPTDGGVPDEIENFRVGGYVVLRKWLQPPHRSAGEPQYERIAAAVGRTIEMMRNIDAAIIRAGGWPAAFESA